MVRRTNKELRFLILNKLKSGLKSINDLAQLAGINWNTTERQITWLKGKDLIEVVYKSKRIRIFAITKEGKEYLKKMKNV